ncbi:uncharacterized protein LOC111640657 [Centruroides sculpturatus]|uniref:uncharacterized protein LOC111640657 n=1 Tax=Centruroides sculpturatus TaxID=218467 RepID=UPI000C6D6E84|nr:uncharacterized protein LOC111640657 [Centruroides sculpturatus]XP_023242461.1 uncharacterized protein LOC111640657 [Centruroides sculpturatus]
MKEGDVSSNENSNVPFDDGPVAEVTNNMKHNESVLGGLLNMEKCKYHVILTKCKDIHIGSRVEEPKTSCLKKDDEKNEMYDNCCQKLKNKYETYFAYMRSFLWEGKRNDFAIKDYFVELTVEKANLFGKKRGENISLNELFSIQEDGHQTILVTGDPGYGKTTLCKKIAYDWASTNYLQYFHLTVIVVLRELDDKSVKDVVLYNIHNNSHIDRDCKFQLSKLNILVILDGFDELIEKHKVVRFVREESFDISPQMMILITSRPQAAEDIREDMKMRFSIEGFSPIHQEKYIQLMFREDEGKANELISKLNEDEFYREISECPLMLHMLCCLHHNCEMEKIKTITDVYIQIFALITERYVRKTNQNRKFERGKYFVGENLLLRLGKLNLRPYPITSNVLMDNFPNEDEYNFIIGLDILALNAFSQYDKIIQYSFVHRTFEEFLSAFTMYNDFYYFFELCSDKTLLFLLGFYGRCKFPKKFLRRVRERLLTPKFMLQSHKEIKLENNWEQFCSVSRVEVHSYDMDNVRELLELHQFKELYCCFSYNKEFYKEMKEELLSFFNNANFSNLNIYLYLTILLETSKYSYDIREYISCMIDLILNIKRINHSTFFVGINNLLGGFYCFRSVNYSLNIPRDILESLHENDEIIALRTLNMEGTFNNYFLSKEQYKFLRRRIIVSTVKKGMCLMM